MSIPVYLINLERSVDRMNFMQEQLNVLGIDFQRINAIDANDFSIEDIAQLPFSMEDFKQNDVIGGIEKATMACTLSHLKVWQELIASDSKMAVVLEDDVHLSVRMKEVIAGIANTELDFDVIKLEVYTRKKIQLHKRKYSVSSGCYLSQLRSRHLGTGAYIITKTCAKRLLLEKELYSDAIDQLIFAIGKHDIANNLKSFQIQPAIAIQDHVLMDSIKKPSKYESTIDPFRSARAAPKRKSTIRKLKRSINKRIEFLRRVVSINLVASEISHELIE